MFCVSARRVWHRQVSRERKIKASGTAKVGYLKKQMGRASGYRPGAPDRANNHLTYTYVRTV